MADNYPFRYSSNVGYNKFNVLSVYMVIDESEQLFMVMSVDLAGGRSRVAP